MKDQDQFIETNREELHRAAKSSVVGHYRLLGERNSTRFAFNNDNATCFANFRSMHSDSGNLPPYPNPFAFLTMDTQWDICKENTAFIRYVTNESPYSKLFLEEVPVNKFWPIQLDVKYNPRFLIGGAALLRHRRELPNVVKMWYKLVERDVHPDMAFVLANMYQDYDETHFVHQWVSHGHQLFNMYATKESIVGWMQHKPTIDIKKYTVAENNFTYNGYWELWGPVRSPSDIEIPNKMLRTIKDRFSWGYGTIQVYRWSEVDKFLDEFLSLNRLKETYDKAATRTRRSA